MRLWREQEWLRRGRITPALAVVIGAQEIVFFRRSSFFLERVRMEFCERVIYERVRIISCYDHKEVE